MLGGVLRSEYTALGLFLLVLGLFQIFLDISLGLGVFFFHPLNEKANFKAVNVNIDGLDSTPVIKS